MRRMGTQIKNKLTKKIEDLLPTVEEIIKKEEGPNATTISQKVEKKIFNLLEEKIPKLKVMNITRVFTKDIYYTLSVKYQDKPYHLQVKLKQPDQKVGLPKETQGSEDDVVKNQTELGVIVVGKVDLGEKPENTVQPKNTGNRKPNFSAIAGLINKKFHITNRDEFVQKGKEAYLRAEKWNREHSKTTNHFFGFDRLQNNVNLSFIGERMEKKSDDLGTVISSTCGNIKILIHEHKAFIFSRLYFEKVKEEYENQCQEGDEKIEIEKICEKFGEDPRVI